MSDIGMPQRIIEVEPEPLVAPDAPIEEPATPPTPAPMPEREPEKVPA